MTERTTPSRDSKADETRARLVRDALSRPGVADAVDLYTRASANLPHVQVRPAPLRSSTGANPT